MYIGTKLHAWAPTPIVAGLSLVTGGLGMILAGSIKAYWALVIGYGFGIGLSNGFGYGVALSTANMMGSGAYTPVKRGLATGLAVAGYTACPLFFSYLIKSQVAQFGPHAVLIKVRTCYL
jgi:hypothetical protein